MINLPRSEALGPHIAKSLIARLTHIWSKGLEIEQKLSAIKVIYDLNDKRLALFSSPQVIQRVMQDRDKMKAKIESLQRTTPKYEAVISIEQEAGKPDKRKSR